MVGRIDFLHALGGDDGTIVVKLCLIFVSDVALRTCRHPPPNIRSRWISLHHRRSSTVTPPMYPTMPS